MEAYENMKTRFHLRRQSTLILLSIITITLLATSINAVFTEDPKIRTIETTVIDPEDDDSGDNETGDDNSSDDPSDDDSASEEPTDEQSSTKKSTRAYTFPTNKPPIAKHNGPYTANVNEPITLDASASYDPDDDKIIIYKWNLGNGNIEYGEIITISYDSEYEYYITLTVYDEGYLKDSSSTTATIIQPNRAPEPPVITGLADIFTDGSYSYAAQSSDKDNDDIIYTFDWDDNSETKSSPSPLPSGHNYNALHNWGEPGDYTITVTVTDGELSSSAEFDITVTEPVQVTNIAIVIIAIILIAALLLVFLTRKH